MGESGQIAGGFVYHLAGGPHAARDDGGTAWLFEAGRKNDKPVAVRVQIEHTFNLK
jgi:hypothetical protein